MNYVSIGLILQESAERTNIAPGCLLENPQLPDIHIRSQYFLKHQSSSFVLLGYGPPKWIQVILMKPQKRMDLLIRSLDWQKMQKIKKLQRTAYFRQTLGFLG